MYTSYNSKKEENVYATWPKEKNTWGNKNECHSSSPPLTPPPRIKRNLKPGKILLKKGYIEVDY